MNSSSLTRSRVDYRTVKKQDWLCQVPRTRWLRLGRGRRRPRVLLARVALGPNRLSGYPQVHFALVVCPEHSSKVTGCQRAFGCTRLCPTVLLLSSWAQCLCVGVCWLTCCAVISRNSGPDCALVIGAPPKVSEGQWPWWRNLSTQGADERELSCVRRGNLSCLGRHTYLSSNWFVFNTTWLHRKVCIKTDVRGSGGILTRLGSCCARWDELHILVCWPAHLISNGYGERRKREVQLKHSFLRVW